MKILGLVASPRKLGNSEILIKEMAASLPGNHSITLLRLSDLNIRHCQACYACLPAENSCILDDDLPFFLDAVAQADCILLGTPCYFLGAHTSLKLIGDRLISILHNGARFAGKKCVITVTYGVPGWDGYAREAAMSFARFLHLDVLGVLSLCAANPGEVAQPDILAQARHLAQRLLPAATPAAPSSPPLHCPSCDSSLLHLSPSGAVSCPLCDWKGAIANTGSVLSLAGPCCHQRYSAEGMEHHAAVLDQIKNEFIKTRTSLYRLRQPYKSFDHWWIKPPQKDEP